MEVIVIDYVFLVERIQRDGLVSQAQMWDEEVEIGSKNSRGYLKVCLFIIIFLEFLGR